MRIYNSWLTASIFVLLLSLPAHATLVNTWDYSVSSVFIDTTFTAGDTATYTTVTPTSLTWGRAATNAGQSSLVIEPAVVPGQVDTYVGNSPPASYWADSISLTHNNNPIYAPSLLSTTLVTTVALDPFDPDYPALPSQSFDFRIKFAETTNQGNYQNDVFALIDGFPNLNFSYDSVFYYVNIFPSDGNVLSALTGEYATLAGVPDGTIGFTTVEGESTTLPFAFTISTRPMTTVPEPATLFLLGSGLAGLAFYRRKRK